MEFTIIDRILWNLNYNLNFTLMLFSQFPLDDLDLKLSRHHIPIITTLDVVGPMCMTRIARTLALPNSRATYQVDTLAKLGIVERLPDPKDRRKINIALTQKGRAIIDACKKMAREDFEQKVSGLSEEELEKVNSWLDDPLQLVHDLQETRNELQIELSRELFNAIQNLFSGLDLVPLSAARLETLELLFSHVSNTLTGGEGFETFR